MTGHSWSHSFHSWLQLIDFFQTFFVTILLLGNQALGSCFSY